jgi:hypothetical protein
VANPKGCSIDPFAYVSAWGESAAALPGGWSVTPAAPQDRDELAAYYDHVSGGLMLEAMDLFAGSCGDEDIDREFRDYGFRRERRCFALKSAGRLKAFLVASVSDIGLNLSDLTNCIHLVAVNSEGLTREVLTGALHAVARATGQEGVPALINPVAAAQQAGLPVDKVYHFWAFHIYGQGQNYAKYLSRLTRYI